MAQSVTGGVERRTLENGLRVLAKESRAAPVAAVVAHVRVGYFNEPDHRAGISHVLEHMLFKGTETRPGKEEVADFVRGLGGVINAGTYYEDTTYYVTVPSLHASAAVEVLADMIRRPLLAPDELASELEVIIQESRQKRDNPRAVLLETMYAIGYDHHRIRRWRIGEDETLRALTRDDLLQFMERTYRPENIVVAIVGDIGAEDAFSFAEQWWGGMERGTLDKEEPAPEPPRQGLRFHRMRGDIQQRLFIAGFPAPSLLAAEAPASIILDAVLSDGRSSRLYRTLKEERRLVNAISAAYEGFGNLGVFAISGESASEDPLPAEQGVMLEARRLQEEGVTARELDRVKTRIRSRWLFAQEEVLGLARSLAHYEVLGGYELADVFQQRLEGVTAEEVVRAADTLQVENAAIVEYLPEAARAPERSADSLAPLLMPAPARRAARQLDGEILERTLDSGATLLFRPRTDLPIVSFHILFPGGRRAERPDCAGLTNLLLKTSLKGAGPYDAAEIAGIVEGLGAGIGMSLALDYFGYSIKLLADRVADGTRVLKEVIRSPRFEPEEVDREKEAILAEIRRQQDSMFSRAQDLFARACFGDSAYGLPSAGMAPAVMEMTEQDLRSWHERWVHGRGAVIGVVGDIEEARLLDLVEELIPSPQAEPMEEPRSLFQPPGEESVTVDRQQTAALIGFRGAAIHEETRHALDLIAEITSGLAGRFFLAVRGERGLAYAVSSFHRSRKDAGIFGAYTATSPENERIARDTLLSECDRLTRELVSPGELASAKSAIRGEQTIYTQTFSAQAGELAAHRILGLPVDEAEQYLARVDLLTPEELREAARRHLRPDECWLGVVRGAPSS